MTIPILEVGPDKRITPEDVRAVALGHRNVRLSKRGIVALRRSRAVVDDLTKRRKPVYGLTTGFGKFKDVFINESQTEELQRNLIMSHSVGVGEEMTREAVRASLFVRINSLSKGYSGVRVEFLDTAIRMLNADICPVVPSQGSVGASGDLAPLSHMGLALMGEGMVSYRGKRMASRAALRLAGLEPVRFMAKEGLAWNNGTSVMLGLLSLAVVRAEALADVSDIACALSLEALRGVSAAFMPKLHRLRPHKGQLRSAANIRKLVRESHLVDSQPNRVQDAYSLRCAPQVHGASRDAIAFVRGVVETELQSVTDNPVIFPENGTAVSGGHFHGEPLAQAADFLSIAVTELGGISERRSARLVDSATNEGLPLFLVPRERAGLHSGLMIPQYTAAALVSENKVLSHPASVDSIPTSANQEDHVSMGNIAARKAHQVIMNSERVLAVEYLTALQAIDLLNPKKLGKGTAVAYRMLRKRVPFVSHDRILHLDMNSLRDMIIEPTFGARCLAR